MSLYPESASDLIPKLHAGEISSEALVRDCLGRIEATNGVISAWAYLDEDLALAQAKALDGLRLAGRPLGHLHGIPVGVKDILDTADMPTEYGTPIYEGHRPVRDSTVVAKLREAGAVIMGKTVSTEFAFLTPGNTANPHNADHTPGSVLRRLWHETEPRYDLPRRCPANREESRPDRRFHPHARRHGFIDRCAHRI